MAIEIVDFPIKNCGSFHGKMLVHQRVIYCSSVTFPSQKNPPVTGWSLDAQEYLDGEDEGLGHQDLPSSWYTRKHPKRRSIDWFKHVLREKLQEILYLPMKYRNYRGFLFFSLNQSIESENPPEFTHRSQLNFPWRWHIESFRVCFLTTDVSWCLGDMAIESISYFFF